MKEITYKEWIDSSSNCLCECSFYTKEQVYRLGADKSRKKLCSILIENEIKDFRMNIMEGDMKTLKILKSIGFQPAAVHIETGYCKDYYFKKN